MSPNKMLTTLLRIQITLLKGVSRALDIVKIHKKSKTMKEMDR